jgi:hypothetical protein
MGDQEQGTSRCRDCETEFTWQGRELQPQDPVSGKDLPDPQRHGRDASRCPDLLAESNVTDNPVRGEAESRWRLVESGLGAAHLVGDDEVSHRRPDDGDGRTSW